MNYKAVYRTAPATPGLSVSVLRDNNSILFLFSCEIYNSTEEKTKGTLEKVKHIFYFQLFKNMN